MRLTRVGAIDTNASIRDTYRMPNRALFLLQALIVAIVGGIHVLALKHYLYWHYIWLDVPVHFLGGLWLGLLGSWLLAYRMMPARFLMVMATVSIVSIGWEVFEVAAGVPMENSFLLDTSIDISMDLLGGVMGYLVARRLISA